jgi:hypothetical protein
LSILYLLFAGERSFGGAELLNISLLRLTEWLVDRIGLCGTACWCLKLQHGRWSRGRDYRGLQLEIRT